MSTTVPIILLTTPMCYKIKSHKFKHPEKENRKVYKHALPSYHSIYNPHVLHLENCHKEHLTTFVELARGISYV